VKEVEFVDDMSALSSYSFKPNLRTVGPKFGKFLGQIRSALQNDAFDGNAAMDELKSTGAVHLNFDGNEIALEEGDLLIEVKQKEGYFSIVDNGISAALDTNLTEELINEGYIRETTSKIQTMRKEADFVVTDHIKVSVFASEKLCGVISAGKEELCSAVLCDELVLTSEDNLSDDGYAKEWDINGEAVKISVKKL